MHDRAIMLPDSLAGDPARSSMPSSLSERRLRYRFSLSGQVTLRYRLKSERARVAADMHVLRLAKAVFRGARERTFCRVAPALSAFSEVAGSRLVELTYT
jgi:hypothetical protein